VSPTIFAMLTAVERKAQREARNTFFDLRDSGYSASRAHFHSIRSFCWPDAVALLRNDLQHMPRENGQQSNDRVRLATYYGSTALYAVGL
jgi:hypothetical protein